VKTKNAYIPISIDFTHLIMFGAPTLRITDLKRTLLFLLLMLKCCRPLACGNAMPESSAFSQLQPGPISFSGFSMNSRVKIGNLTRNKAC
jgi:hypothetical protein